MTDDTPTFPDGPPPWPRPDDPAVRDALLAAVAAGSWGYHGPYTTTLAERLAERHGVGHAVLCASGTLAVEAALRALRVGPGDAVALAAYDYEPNFLAVHAAGATPVLVNLAPGTLVPDPAALDAALRPPVKAVVVTHLHGARVPMPAVCELARARGVAVVEDAAQAAGAVVAGRPAGAWGDAGVLSFGGSKLLPAGRGGAVLTDRDDIAQRLRLFLRRGVQEWAALSELQAAVLLPQLDRLADDTARRADAVRHLLAGLAGVPGLRPVFDPDTPTPAYYKAGFRYDAAAFGLPRDLFVRAVRAEGVAFDAGFRALHAGRSPSRYAAAGPLDEAARAGEDVVVLHHPVLLTGPAGGAGVAAAVRKVYLNAGRLSP